LIVRKTFLSSYANEKRTKMISMIIRARLWPFGGPPQMEPTSNSPTPVLNMFYS